MPRVHVPRALREHTGGQVEIELPGRTVGELIDALEERHPGIKARLVSDETTHGLRPGLAIWLDGHDLASGTRTKVPPDSTVYFVPAQAGGRL